MKTWHKARVLRGDKSGRTIGFPTINLDPAVLSKTTQTGVYACSVKLDDTDYIGTLFYGPRLVKGESHPVLEIFIHDFDEEIYDRDIEFMLCTYIRKVESFETLADMKLQIEKDIKVSETLRDEIIA